MSRWYHMLRMDLRNAVRARLRAFYWPPPGPLRRLATINAAIWGVVCLVDLTQPNNAAGRVVYWGILLCAISWALVRLCVIDQGGHLALRLPIRWLHAPGGRFLFGFQSLITAFLLQHDLFGWAARPVLVTAANDLGGAALILGCTWGIPAATVAVVTQARLVAAGQTGGGNQPPPHGQQWQHGQQQSNPYESWGDTQQDIPQDEAWTQPPPGARPPPPIHDAAWACGVLHVHPNATLEQIERVFKNLASTWHPDTAKSPEEWAEKDAHMRELNEAIDLLRMSRKNSP